MNVALVIDVCFYIHAIITINKQSKQTQFSLSLYLYIYIYIYKKQKITTRTFISPGSNFTYTQSFLCSYILACSFNKTINIT